MKCVAIEGYVFDLSEDDMRNNVDFGLSYLLDARHYKSLRPASLFKPEYADEKKKLQYQIAEGIAKGIVRPLYRVVYSPKDVSRAFRLQSLKLFSGNVLINMTDVQVSDEVLNVTSRFKYSAEGTYIVVCGDTKFGIEVADRLVKRGVRKLLLHVNPNSLTGYLHIKLTSWKKLDVQVKISSENLTSEKECINLIKEGTNMAPVFGIFVVQNYSTETKGVVVLEPENMLQKFNNDVRVVASLDVSSRKLCNNLKHFVVLNNSSKTASDSAVEAVERICEARSEARLPSLAFRSYAVTEFDNNVNNETKTRPQKLSTVMNALETSLKLNYTNVVTFDLKKQNSYDFLEKVAKIIGVQHIDDIDESLTLERLNVNDIGLLEIKQLLHKVYDMIISTEKLAQLDISSLKNFTIVKRHNTKFDAGLGAFYTYTDEDECKATEPMVLMPTKLSNGSEEEQELDPNETYLILVPGFEGHHQIFTRVSERLKVQAMAFQLGPDMADDNIQKMAGNILKFMKKRFKLKSNFYLLGYSFGVNVALELAALLEKEGRVGTVYCLDSSPDALRVQLDAYIGHSTDTELQNSIAEHMYRLMTGTDSEELKKDLEKSDTWSEKVKACVRRLRGLASYSNQYKTSILQAAYRRIMEARQYEPNLKLQSELILIKGIPHPKAKPLPEDYNLSKYTTKPVKVFQIESDHASAPYDCRVSNIVNKFLAPDLLSKFEKEVLCDTYLVESFKMM